MYSYMSDFFLNTLIGYCRIRDLRLGNNFGKLLKTEEPKPHINDGRSSEFIKYNSSGYSGIYT